MRRYRRTASGAKTAVIAMLQAMECQAGVATGPPSIRPRLALASAVTGLTLTQACSQPGRVLVWMNTLLPNASGNMTMNPNPCRLCGDLTYRPRSTQIQPTAKPKTSISPTAPSAASGLVAIRNPSSDPYAKTIATETR